MVAPVLSTASADYIAPEPTARPKPSRTATPETPARATAQALRPQPPDSPRQAGLGGSARGRDEKGRPTTTPATTSEPATATPTTGKTQPTSREAPTT